MIQFPAWTQEGSAAEQKKLRLRFLVNHLASFVSPASSHEALAQEIGVSKGTIYSALYRGYFTRPIATTIVAKFGERSGVTREMLTQQINAGATGCDVEL